MNRPSREDTLMYIAQTMALRSTCMRRGVGCVIAWKGRVIATGYNGQPQPYDKTCEELCTVGSPCIISNHAEVNALEILREIEFNMFRNGRDVVLYTTLSPCVNCANKIYLARIEKVVYLEEYRDNSGILFLKNRGIIIEQHTYKWQFPKINFK